MKETRKAAKLLKRYLKWPLLFVCVMAAATLSIFVLKEQSAVMIMAVWTIVALLLMLIVYLSFKGKITKALVGFAMDAQETGNILAEELDVPYALLSEDGGISWCNERFAAAIPESMDKDRIRKIEDIFPELDDDELRGINKDETYIFDLDDHVYRTIVKPVDVSGEFVFAIYLYDDTELTRVKIKAGEDRPIVGLIYLDNYEEAMESVEEVQKSLLIALIDRKVGKYFADIDGIVKKLEKDKYLFVIKNKYLPKLEEKRFEILEQVKTVNIGNSMPVTCSIGAGTGSDSFAGDYANARNAIDMALGRGGDQAVLRDGSAVRYFGGKSQSIEKSTRVKARVKAQAFRELLLASDRLVVMGHKLPDIDSVGASVGVWRIANALGKQAHIVIGDTSPAIQQMLSVFKGSDYPEDMFINRRTAASMMEDGVLLAIVDVNRPGITEAPEVLDRAKTVVVFDHHRQSSDAIDKAELSYVEPYASSTCEMITEIVQYIDEKVTLKPAEADAMYAGIVIDTNNFTNQAGVRTFEAAAYLRKSGADITKVRKAFRDSISDYRAKAEAIHNADIYRSAFAIGRCNGDGLATPTVVGARAANELLDIEGIKASIVMTEFDGKIFLSARSIDEVNVQVMMEHLGGGGHRSIAGAQLAGETMESAKKKVEEIIDEMIDRGDVVI